MNYYPSNRSDPSSNTTGYPDMYRAEWFLACALFISTILILFFNGTYKRMEVCSCASLTKIQLLINTGINTNGLARKAQEARESNQVEPGAVFDR